MTLEDFFTQTEMKDGLTSHSRVEELISVMQKDKESVIKNDVETARQWSIVANALAATENRDTLDHFVRLDGLLFLDRWLQVAQKPNNSNNDTYESSVEESVSLLLGILEKLPIDNKRFVSSGIEATVKKLLSHKSLKVQERARAVFDVWSQCRDCDVDQQGSTDDRVNHDDGAVVGSESQCIDNTEIDGNLVGNEHSDDSPCEGIRDVKIFVTSNRDNSETILKQENKEDGFRENAVDFSIGICSNSAFKEKDLINGSLDSVDKKETSSASSLHDVDHHQTAALSNTDDAKEADCIEMPLSAGVDDDDDDACTRAVESEEDKKHVSSNGMEVDGSHSDVVENSPCNGNQDSPNTETSRKVEEVSGESVEKGNGIFSVISNLNSGMDEFDYGIDDALEVARQVAKQVEREVVDYREELCSSPSSEKNISVVRPCSPESINGAQGECVVESPNKEEDHLDKNDTHEECMQKSDPTEKLAESKKGMLGDIDLNELFLSEDHVEHPPSTATTITFVSASKVTPSGVPPKAPFHFEGELGWKGCAATSAFRPASVRSPPVAKKEFLDFDLNNVADCCGDPIPIPIPSGEESSVEVSSIRAQRLKLDLNLIGDNEDDNNNPLSPASSSSSRQFPMMRNIDLNGNPSLFDDPIDQRPPPPVLFGKRSSSLVSGGFKLDDPVVSIMGARVSVNKPELIPQTRSFLSRAENGYGMTNHFSMPQSYGPPPPPSNSPMFGYNNGLSMMGSLPPPAAMYGLGPGHHVPVPCMLDSRGAPQMMMPSSSSADARPYFMSMSMGVPVMSLNGGMSMSRPSFDLNSAESRDGGGLGQLYIPEQMSHSAASGLGMKRKEPEGGWDLYPLGYKHHQPSWR
ncbi:hypothetical protein ACHQM5_020870 [Ranunculus cassubicifolius]